MRAQATFLTLLLAAGLLSCRRQPEPQHLVILIDVSGSIDRGGLEQAFKALDEVVSHLQRGDRIAIIPILGDAQAEASGRIIRFEVPKERRAYDADLRNFRHKLGFSLGEMRINAAAHPGSKTDILGSIELAGQEFETTPSGARKLLVILSDFIHDRGDIDFRREPRLVNPSTAREFALQTVKTVKVNADNIKGAYTYLGFLRSNEYAGIGDSRRRAINEFWIKYFALSGVQTRLMTDGPGLIGFSQALRP